jgi:hypothetical protein
MKVTCQALGGELRVIEVEDGEILTVGDVKAEMECENYACTVNGEPADDDFELADFEFCTLSPQVKGG